MTPFLNTNLEGLVGEASPWRKPPIRVFRHPLVRRALPLATHPERNNIQRPGHRLSSPWTYGYRLLALRTEQTVSWRFMKTSHVTTQRGMPYAICSGQSATSPRPYRRPPAAGSARREHGSGQPSQQRKISNRNARTAPAPSPTVSPWTTTTAQAANPSGKPGRLARRYRSRARQPTTALGNHRRKSGGTARASKACSRAVTNPRRESPWRGEFPIVEERQFTSP